MAHGTPTWTCIHHCGACCRLAPEERQEALDALTEEQRETYLGMVGEDGWCKHYDSGGRRRIYAERPTCRVSSLDLFDAGRGHRCFCHCLLQSTFVRLWRSKQ